MNIESIREQVNQLRDRRNRVNAAITAIEEFQVDMENHPKVLPPQYPRGLNQAPITSIQNNEDPKTLREIAEARKATTSKYAIIQDRRPDVLALENLKLRKLLIDEAYNLGRTNLLNGATSTDAANNFDRLVADSTVPLRPITEQQKEVIERRKQNQTTLTVEQKSEKKPRKIPTLRENHIKALQLALSDPDIESQKLIAALGLTPRHQTPYRPHEASYAVRRALSLLQARATRKTLTEEERLILDEMTRYQQERKYVVIDQVKSELIARFKGNNNN